MLGASHCPLAFYWKLLNAGPLAYLEGTQRMYTTSSYITE